VNESKTDRIIRAVVGVIMLIIAFWVVSGVAQIILWIIGGILVVTAAIGFCPLYALLHISTKPNAK
jgi:hypothetical protein